MTSYGAYTLIHANSSLIHYTGDWNLTSYMPISDGATASLNFTGAASELTKEMPSNDRLWSRYLSIWLPRLIHR